MLFPLVMVTAMFLDVHCHLSDGLLRDALQDILDRAENTGMTMLTAGESKASNIASLNLQERYTNIKGCIGLHPNLVSKMSDKEIEYNMDFILSNVGKAFALSEIGLDYKWKDEAAISRQKKIFSRILEIAEADNKVVIVHTRKAMNDMLDVLSSFKVKAILHNFEGNSAQCSRACDMNVGISVSTGFMKFRRDSIIRKIRPDLLFTETDSPSLSPDENVNTPLNIVRLVDYVSKVRGKDAMEIKGLIYSNFLRMFYG